MKRLSTFTRFGVLLLGAVVVVFSSCKKEEDPPCAVAANNDSYGTVTTVPNSAGNLLTLTAHPNEGYMFSHWTVSGMDDVRTDNPLFLSMIAVSDVSVRAEFLPVYRIDISADENGTVGFDGIDALFSKDKAGKEFPAGRWIHLVATPNEGYAVHRVTIESGGIVIRDGIWAPQLTYDPFPFFIREMPAADVSVRVEFVKLYTAKAVVNEGGSMQFSRAFGGRNGVLFIPGDKIVVHTNPNVGYVFKQWTVVSGNLSIEDPTHESLNFDMPAEDVVLLAEFEKIQNQGRISIVVEGDGSAVATVDGEEVTRAWMRERVHLTATPGSGNAYVWASLGSNGGEGTNLTVDIACYTVFIMPAGDVSVTVKFFDLPADIPSVEIDGTVWATRNVAEPGTFADAPWDAGGYYSFDQAQDVCPDGWRMPTQQEFKKLKESANQWVTAGGTNGRLYGSGEQKLFLPAAGHWWNYNGLNVFLHPDYCGFYWANSYEAVFDNVATLEQILIFTANALSPSYMGFMDMALFGLGSAYLGDISDRAFSVRCVKE